MTRLLVLALVTLGAVSAAAQEADRERALTLFEQAETAYRAGRFDASAALLEEAYRLHPEPRLQYNLGRSYEGAGDLERAQQAYERYLAATPDAANAPQVRARLATLERLRQATAAPPPPSPPPTRTRSADPVPWIGFGFAAAGLGAAAVVGWLADERAASSREAPDHRTAAPFAQEAHDFALAANVTFIAAGVLAVICGIWGIVDAAEANASPTAAVPSVLRF